MRSSIPSITLGHFYIGILTNLTLYLSSQFRAHGMYVLNRTDTGKWNDLSALESGFRKHERANIDYRETEYYFK